MKSYQYETMKYSPNCDSFLKRFYLPILKRQEGREGEKHQGPLPRHVPWSGIKPATFGFAEWYSTNWSTLARALLWQFIYSVEPEHKGWIGMTQNLPRLKNTHSKFHKTSPWLLFSPGRYTNVTWNKKVSLIVMNSTNHNAGGGKGG